MGKIPTVPAPSRVVRLSPPAWALALDAANRKHLPGDDPAVPSSADAASGATTATRLPGSDGLGGRGSAWAELQRQGVADGGELVGEWADALAAALRPVILLRLSAAFLGRACNSDFAIAGARGVAVLRRSTIEPDDDGGLRTVSREPALEIAVFDLEHIWGAITPVLPPLLELRAAAEEAGTPPSGNVPRIPLTPAEAALVPEDAILSAAITTRAGAGRKVWAARWSVGQGTLYSTRTANGAVILTPQQPGHVAREITSALAGACEALPGGRAGA